MKKFLLFNFLTLSLFLKAQTGIWGVTSAGGHYNGGTIFKTDGSGNNYSIKKSLFQYCGEYGKANLCQASNGKLYGMTSSCCVFGAYGILFEYDPSTKEFDKLFNFSDTIDGTNPDGAVIQALNGKLYGMTTRGGKHNWGAIFQYDLSTKTYTKLHDFDDANGSLPEGNLLQASDGKLYGVTNAGGTYDYGVLFKFDPVTSEFTKMYDFNGNTGGGSPRSTLIQAKNGKLYGTNTSDASGGTGTIFEFDPANSSYSDKYIFDGKANGGLPCPELVEGADGNLYGTTVYGGTGDYGVLFQFVIANSGYTVKFNFDNEAHGAYSQTGLVKLKNGNFYGVTQYGGVNNDGVVFEYDPTTSNVTKKFDFSNEQDGTGRYPQALLVEATDGKLYGMTYTGALADVGGVFQFDPQTNNYTRQFDFHTSEIGNMPVASLIYANDKMLYGITETGGIKNKGTIFQYDPVLETYTKKFEFLGAATGEIPVGGIVQATDGKIYGTTTLGGAFNKGVLFQFDPITNDYKVEFEFDSINGSMVLGELMQASDGKIYGLTTEGGVDNSGVLFQYDPSTSKLIKKYDFKSDGNGKNPEGGLVQDGDKLLGVTTSGGKITGDYPDGLGAIFQYDLTTGNYMKRVDCDSINGAMPNGTLVKTPEGKYFGLASRGGLINKNSPDGYGTIYQYDPSNETISGKFNFNGTENGMRPNGSLLLATDGNLYGVTNMGGIANYGTLFQFNPKTNVFAKKMDFAKNAGMLAERCKLIEISLVNGIRENQQLKLNLDCYPNPSGNEVAIMVNEAVSNATVRVYTVTGQVVLEKEKLSGTKFLLQIDNLANGTYFVELSAKGKSKRTKLIKSVQ